MCKCCQSIKLKETVYCVNPFLIKTKSENKKHSLRVRVGEEMVWVEPHKPATTILTRGGRGGQGEGGTPSASCCRLALLFCACNSQGEKGHRFQRNKWVEPVAKKDCVHSPCGLTSRL